MYSLAGDLQHDRFGFPILDNNNGDNFLLSRAPTIYDFMARKGLSFRVYESFPSVTMLRMFARYATDTTNIVPSTGWRQTLSVATFPPSPPSNPRCTTTRRMTTIPTPTCIAGRCFCGMCTRCCGPTRALGKDTADHYV